jgi:hypothetical protein
VLAVGLATSGLSLFVWALIEPERVLQVRNAPSTPDALKAQAWLSFFVLLTAVGFALAFSGLVRMTRGDRYSLSVWKKSLGLAPPQGYIPHATLDIVDGPTIDGVLHAFTLAPDLAHRDISLIGPIGYTWEGLPRVATDLAMLNVTEERFRYIAIEYRRDPKIPLGSERKSGKES